MMAHFMGDSEPAGRILLLKKINPLAADEGLILRPLGRLKFFV